MTESGDGNERPRSLLADCFVDPAGNERRLPAVLALLEADDEVTRLAAAWTCCLVAVDDPDIVEYVVDRLTDRVGRLDHATEIDYALEFLVERYPDRVANAFDEAATTDRYAGPGLGHAPGAGGPTTPQSVGQPSRPGVGRVSLPGTAGADDPRTSDTTGGPTPREYAHRTDRHDPDSDATDATDEETGRPPDRDAYVRQTDDVSAIASRSAFDRLDVFATQDRSRYSEDYRALVGSQTGEERAITLRLLSAPDEVPATARFDAMVGEVLAEWSAVETHPNLVTVLDWGVEPRPWLATSFAGKSLADGADLEPTRALSDAIDLAAAVAHLHRNDVVHAGIDPGNVAYPGDDLDGTEQERPVLNNVGLVGRLRHVQNPASLLDPRYAAPEYFDRRFGTVDATTDVYQLGAVVFRRFTGRPPVEGSFAEVRDAVTSPSRPVPSEVADVPAGLDDVLAKALAPQKLTRYETVEHFQQDLRSLGEDAP